jgi:hypothetical protein
LADPYQATSVIATALCDARKDHPEEAKQIAKCIVEALSDAGFQIMPAQKDRGIGHAQAPVLTLSQSLKRTIRNN